MRLVLKKPPEITDLSNPSECMGKQRDLPAVPKESFKVVIKRIDHEQ
jgi:hypothetical protein